MFLLAAQAAALPDLLSAESLVALVTLTSLEIVLGIDNLVFISILCGKLPPEQRRKARNLGIALAVLTRIALLLTLSALLALTTPLFNIFGHGMSGKDLVLLAGGLFLIYKATHEIHEKLEDPGRHGRAAARAAASFAGVIVQIMLIDIVFSIDSVVTAVGMAQRIEVMVIAVLASAAVMVVLAGPIMNFVDRHPTIKMLALSFLLLIGVTITAEAFHASIPKGYIYFAMAFSLLVEMLNMAARRGHVTAASAPPPQPH